MIVTMSKASMLAMRVCTVKLEFHGRYVRARMNGRRGDIVSQAKLCAASPDNRLARPFGNIDVAMAGILLLIGRLGEENRTHE